MRMSFSVRLSFYYRDLYVPNHCTGEVTEFKGYKHVRAIESQGNFDGKRRQPVKIVKSGII